MRKIVQIQIGQCGNQIGASYWKNLCKEAGVTEQGYFHYLNFVNIGEAMNNDSKQYLPFYYQEQDNHYCPRTVFIDTDPTALDDIQASENKNLFSQNSFVLEQIPSQGVYIQSDTKFETQIEDVIQKQVEGADSLQGFKIILGTAGGTGSGIGSFVINKLAEKYQKKTQFQYIVYPTMQTCRSPLDLYNTVLSFSSLYQHPTTFVFDNEAVQNTCMNTFYDQTPDYNSMNQLISNAILGTTQSFRHPGKGNTSFQKMEFSLNPIPLLHYITITQAPLINQCGNLTQLCSQLFTDNQPFFSYNPSQGKYLTCSLLLRGNVSLPDIDRAIYNIQPRESFIKYLPDNIQKTLCSEYGELSAMLLSNQTATQFSFQTILDEFYTLFQKKQYLHVYQNAGIQEEEFSESLHNLQDLISELGSSEKEEVSQEEYGEEEIPHEEYREEEIPHEEYREEEICQHYSGEES